MRRRRPGQDTGALRLLEFSLFALIASGCMAVVLHDIGYFVDKTRLSEVFDQSDALREAMIEEFALNGSFGTSSADLLRREAPYGSAFNYHRNGSRVEVTGTLPHPDRPFRLDFHAAVLAQGPSPMVLWQCANRLPPPGWIEPDAEDHTTLSADLTPSICRSPGLQ